MNLGTSIMTLFATLGLDSSSFEKGIDSAKGEAEGFSKTLETLANKTKALSAVGAGVAGGLLKLASDAGKTADDLTTLSKTTGISTDTLQEFQYASELVDVSTETLTGSIRTLTRYMSQAKNGNADTAQAFERLGVKVTKSNGKLRNAEEVFYDVIEALSEIQDPTERDAAAMEVLGRNAQELNPIIEDGGKQLKALGKEAKASGMILSKDALNGANKLNDAMDKLKTSVKMSVTSVGASLAEKLAPAVEKLGEWIKGLLDRIKNVSSDKILSILKIAAVVAAISPLLSVLSKVQTAMTLISSHPLIVGAAVIIGLITGIVSAINGAQEPTSRLGEEYHQLAEDIASAAERLEQYESAISATEQGIIDAGREVSKQYDGYKDLADRMIEIVDAQGKVLKGHEDEAEFIRGELSDALGIEIEIVNGVVKEYGKVKDAIYDNIKAKQAEAVLNASADEYSEALERQLELSNELSEAQRRYTTVTEGYSATLKKKKDLEAAIAAVQKMDIVNNNELYEVYEHMQEQLAQVTEENAFYGSQLQAVTGELANATEAYNRNASVIENYDRLLEATTSGVGDIETALLVFSNNMRTSTNATEGMLQEQLDSYKKKYAEMKTAVEEHGAKISQSQFDELEKMIKITEVELKKAKGEFVSAVEDWAGEFYSVGTDIANGMARGIEEHRSTVRAAASRLAQDAVEESKFRLAVASPSKVMAKIGGFTAEGFAEGITDNIKLVDKAMDKMSLAAMDMNADPVIPRNDYAGGNTITLNVYGAAGQDVNELADIISRRINDVVARDRRVFA